MAKFCSECGKELAEDEVFCTKCGAKVGGSSSPTISIPDSVSNVASSVNVGGNKKKILIAVGLVLLFLVGCFAFAGGGGGSKMTVKADEMIDAYIRDQGTAEKTYKDKNVSITGVVMHKQQFKDSNDFNITLAYKAAAGRKYYIDISVPAEKVEIVNKAEEGKYISVSGKCVGIVPQDEPTKVSVQIRADKINQ